MSIPQRVINDYFIALESGDLEGVRKGVDAGVSPDIRDETSSMPSLSIAAEKGYLAIVSYLLAKGADRHAEYWGRLRAADIARARGFKDIQDLLQSYDAPLAPIISKLSKDIIFAPDASGMTPMDNPETWNKYFSSICRLLEDRKDLLTKQDLLGKNVNGFSWIEKAAMFGRLGRVMTYLRAIGDPLEKQDLITQDDEGHWQPTSLLRMAITTEQLKDIFQVDHWRGAALSDVRAIFRTLPEEAKSQVPNYQTTLAALQSTQRGMRQEPQL